MNPASDLPDCAAPVLGFAAFSGTGKTTLLTRLIPRLGEHGLRVGLVKHSHHDFDIDIPGKDSYELRKAGAQQVLVASSRRWALITETPGREEADLGSLLGKLDSAQLDLILVEGFRHLRFPKIELHRAALGRPWLYPDDDSIVALAADERPGDLALPWFHIDDLGGLTEFVVAFCYRHRREASDR